MPPSLEAPLVTLANASASEAAPVAVRLRHVSKSFPGVQALRDVSFDLLAGEVHGLVGANGAGKSTMIRMLSGASTPDSGEIEVGGAPLLNDNPRHLRAIGISAIYQELTIIPEMTALRTPSSAPRHRAGASPISGGCGRATPNCLHGWASPSIRG